MGLQAHEYGWVPFPPLPDGTQRWVKFDEKGEIVLKRSTQMSAVRAALDHNATARNHTTGMTKDRTMVRVASIPAAVQLKWMVEEGLDAQNPEHADRLMRKLNDPDWAYLRTGGGNLAMTQDGNIR